MKPISLPVLVFLFANAAQAEITRIWLSHRTNTPGKIVVNWESAKPGNSVVRFRADQQPLQTVSVEENNTLHHVEIPLVEKDTTYRYSVQTGDERSPEAVFKAYPTDNLRVAVVADWQGKPKLDSVLKDDSICCSPQATISTACTKRVAPVLPTAPSPTAI